MCGKAVKKVFGGGSTPKVVQAEPTPPPAVAQAAPNASDVKGSEINNGETNTNAKGKKKLIINKVSGVGTGVNL